MVIQKKLFLGSMLALSLGACSTIEGSPDSFQLTDVPQKNGVYAYPFRVTESGLWVMDIALTGKETQSYIVDTGATRTAIFQNHLNKFDQVSDTGNIINIYGMTGTDQNKTIRMFGMVFGHKFYEDYELVVLAPRHDLEDENIDPVGVIGMDFLKNFRLYRDVDTELLYLIPADFVPLRVPPSWRTIYLKPNPFSEEDRALHFMDMRIGNILITALLDTGAEINAMNWGSVSNPMIKQKRRRLREQWVLQGAVGEFDPVSFVRAKGFRSGQKRWADAPFYLMDFKNLDILGVDDQSFAIAGGNLFSETSVYIDFQNDIMHIMPDEYDKEFNRRRDVDIVARPLPTARK